MSRWLVLSIIVPLCWLFLPSCHHPKHQQHANVSIDNAFLNQEMGSLFLAKNKLKPGITILPSGLQYHVIREGIGGHPGSNDLVNVFYQGRYIGGQVFDNQHYQNKPVTVRVSSLILGWQEALQLMRGGSIWVLYIPSYLAYGDRGIPGLIGPKQTLVYTVHLLSVRPSLLPQKTRP